ncbi:MAG: ATP-grasp domain-containing protein, partial [Planctomycetota bacterium]|nr:ATP-grasp domain-containing protein [Planctomycetota bacterium]
MQLRRLHILLTGGRAPATLDLARRFASAGHRVFVAESIRQHLCLHSRAVTRSHTVPWPRSRPEAYIEALVDIVKREGIDLLIPTCEEIFYIARDRERIEEHCEVFVDDLSRLDVLHNKFSFSNLAGRLGLKVPRTTLLSSRVAKLDGEREVWQQLKEQRIVLKPVYSRFAAKTRILDQGFDLDGLDASIQWIVQEYIAGSQYSTYSIVREGKIVAHTCSKAIHTAGLGAGIYYLPVDKPAASRWVEALVQGFPFTGQIGLDFIEREDGELFAIDCNPRATSGVHLFRETPNLLGAFYGPLPASPFRQVRCPRMLALPMATYGLASIRSVVRLGAWLTDMVRGRDVIFDVADPLPFLHQVLCFAYILSLGAMLKISPIEAS